MPSTLFKEYNDIPESVLNELDGLIKEYKIKRNEVAKILRKLRREYEDAKISPGESIGVITAESFGEPGTQMCVSSDEKIILKFKNKIKIMKVGEFVDNVFKKVKTRIEKNYEIYNISENLKVLSLDNDEKVKWKKIIALNRVKAPKKLIEITTKSGRSIKATDYHSFVARKHNKVVSIAGKDLNVGDRIPVIKYLPEHCISFITVNNYISNVVEDKGMIVRKGTKSKKIPNVINLDELFGWFIGAYLAEGSANNGQICISNINEDYISNARKFIEYIGLDFKEYWNNRGFTLGRDFKVSSSLLASFINCVCGADSGRKKIPDFSYNAKEKFVSSLLRGYFDGDGNFHVKRKMIRCSSNSEELIKGISLLLTRFGIFSFKTKDKKGQSWLLIPYKYAPLFLKYIGSDIKEKKDALEKLAKMSKRYWNDKSQDYNDMISGFDDLFYKTAKKLGYPIRYINNFTKRQKIGRTALYRYIKLFKKLAKEKKVDIKTELKIMKRMFNSDVVWDEIKEIKYVKPEHPYVYDLSVPGLETFTTFEGIITHNTLNVFHFAGVAEVAVTTGLPRLIEIFDARKEQTTPRTEVYLKRGLGTDSDKVKKIAALIKEVKLEDIADEFSFNLTMFRIDVKLNRKRMREFKVSDSMVVDALTSKLKKTNVKLDNINLKIKLNRDESLNILYQLKEKCKHIVVSGIKGVTQVTPVKRDNEFVILCTGSNLKDILEVEGVDEKKTITNNPFVVADVFGIEAARNVIIKESVDVIKDQGLDIDIRHIMLLADVMTNLGIIKGITRSGITSEKESVLARASFETPIRHLVNASLRGEVDKLNSVIENVMLNQSVPVGTGLPDLVAKMKDEVVKTKKKIKKIKKST